MSDRPAPIPLRPAAAVPDGAQPYCFYVSLGPLVPGVGQAPDPLVAAYFGVRALLVEREAQEYGVEVVRRYETDREGRPVGDLEVRGDEQAIILLLSSLQALETGPFLVRETLPAGGTTMHWSDELTGRMEPS